MYLKIETDNKKMIESLFIEIIEKKENHMVYTKKLDNGCYLLEIIEQSGEEPAICKN